jgi:hypothetical protein
MGLFDNYQFAGHGGQGGGLLDIFRMMQSVPMQQPQGFPQEQAALPPQAQPAQQMPPPQMAQQMPQGPGIGDRMMAGFQGLANAGSPMQALGNLVGGIATGQRSDPAGMYQQQANQTERALIGYGFNPNLAKVVAGNPDLMKAVLPHVMGIGGQTDDIKEYNFAKRENPSLTFEQFMSKKRSVSGEVGLTPIWGTGPDGKVGFIQPGKNGVAVQGKTPDGFTIARDPIKVDTGTTWTFLDPQTRQVINTVPKNVAEEATQRVVGKDKGDAAVELNSIRSKMPGLETVVKKLDELSEKATYTSGGKILDTARRETGMEPRPAAVARAEYTSMVDNQILPLLRDTFGAAFTQKEGDTLRATLGDPDKSPKEKQAILRSFIEQKRRDIQGLETRAGVSAPADMTLGEPQKQPAASSSNAAPIQDGATATHPQTGTKIIMKNGKWVPLK